MAEALDKTHAYAAPRPPLPHTSQRIADAAYAAAPPVGVGAGVTGVDYTAAPVTGPDYAAAATAPMAGMAATTTTVPPVGYDATGAPVCPPGTVPTTTGATRAL